MTDAPDLLPCPFCGSDASHSWSNGGEYVGYAESHTIKCKGCGNCFSRMDDQNPNGGYAISGTALPKVVRLWNTRARPMTVAEAARRLIDEINRPATHEEKPDWRYLSRLDMTSLRALSEGGE